MALAKPKRISDIKPIFGNLAVSSQYEVVFGGLSLELQTYLASRGVDPRFIAEKAGLLCNRASLPGSSVSTFNVIGNYTGVSETFAQGRIFTEIQLDFYVDKEYKTLKFLEHWIEFISNGSGISAANPGYFYRVRYPISYKSNSTKIVKFNRDFKNELQYNFIGLFPKDLISVPVSYDDSQTLIASASFSYERYICGSVTSIDINRDTDNNKELANPLAKVSAVSSTLTTTQSILSPSSTFNKTGQSLGNQPGVRNVTYISGNVNPIVRQ